MRARLATVAAALTAVVGLLVPAAPGAATAGARTAATAVGIGEREYRISVYRPAVRPGRVHFNVVNHGEDVHNFVVRGPGGRQLGQSLDISSGANVTVSVLLSKPGRYTLLCTKVNHQALGMVAHVRVTAVTKARR